MELHPVTGRTATHQSVTRSRDAAAEVWARLSDTSFRVGGCQHIHRDSEVLSGVGSLDTGDGALAIGLGQLHADEIRAGVPQGRGGRVRYARLANESRVGYRQIVIVAKIFGRRRARIQGPDLRLGKRALENADILNIPPEIGAGGQIPANLPRRPVAGRGSPLQPLRAVEFSIDEDAPHARCPAVVSSGHHVPRVVVQTARSRAVAMEYVAAETDSPVIEQTEGKTGGIGPTETAAVAKDGGVIDQRHGGPDPGAHSPGTVPNRQHTARAANHRGIEAVKPEAARCPGGALG